MDFDPAGLARFLPNSNETLVTYDGSPLPGAGPLRYILLGPRGVPPFGVSGPHWKKSCLNHTRNLVMF